MTITTPAGAKVYSASSRRFVVVIEDFAADRPVRASIEKRSDSVAELRAHVFRKGRVFVSGTDRAVRHIIDTATGAVV